jgi:hypothetical protein
VRSSLYLFLPVAALSLNACHMSIDAEDKRLTSDGKPITTSASTTAEFSEIEGIGPDNIVFVTGDAFSIKATGDADAIKKLRYAMDNGTIIIGREKSKWWGNDSKSVTITVTAPSLVAATLAGSGDFTADKMVGDKISVALAGSGNAKVSEVTGKRFKAQIAGSGSVNVAGTVETVAIDVAGSGTIDAAKLASTDADVDIAGSGDVKLMAKGTVKADIAGSGDIIVTGGAKCTSSIAGSGKLNCS